MIDWNKIELKPGAKGEIKTLCPNCSHTRKKKKDPCLSVNVDKGLAKCWNCEAISIKQQLNKIEYALPPQQWQNYTQLSDKLVKWFKEERNISQQTLIELKITEEEYYQPSSNDKVNNRGCKRQ